MPPTIVLLLLTLIMTTSATSMLCAAFLTDHWENLYWDRDALINIVNQSESSSKVTNKLEFLIDDKVARLPLRNGKGGGMIMIFLILLLLLQQISLIFQIVAEFF